MKLIIAVLLVSSTVIVKASSNISEKIAFSNEGTRSALPEKTALEKWKDIEKNVGNLMGKVVKNVLPQVLKISEDLNISGKCSRSILKTLTGLRKMDYWAFSMIDASGKIPNGFVSGSVNSLGDYDSCVNIVVPDNFNGQYCLLDFKPPLPERRPFVSYDNVISEFINATNKQSAIGYFMMQARYYYHIRFRTSVCVPSSCNQSEVQEIASKVVKSLQLNLDVLIPNCEIKQEQIVLNSTELSIAILLSILVFISLVATIADVIFEVSPAYKSHKKNFNIVLKCLLCFSLYTNFKKLMKTDDNPDSIRIFHGIKAITILWVILSHTYFYQNFQVLSNLLEVRKMGKDAFFQIISNGVLAVETFFFISAVLVSYGVTKLNRKLNILMFAIRRLWRLTPPFMLVIACVILLPHLGSGPAWKETITDRLTEKCLKNWWTNLLYISNFITFDELCLNWTWYIPVDTHLYFISLLVLIPLQKNPRLAMIINGVMFVLGMTITAAFHAYYRLHPLAVFVYMHPDDMSYFIDRGYFRTYVHLSSYCIGLSVGYFLATKKKIHLPMVAVIFGWIAAFTAALGVLLGVYNWNQGNVPGIEVSTFFGCTNKWLWTAAVAWVTVACMTGYGGVATTILSWKGFIPLSRLTYMTYLVHPLIHFTYIGSTRTLIAAEHRTLVHQYCGTVVISFLVACVLSLLFEAPFMALEKVFFSPKKKPSEYEADFNQGDEKIKARSIFPHTDLTNKF